MIDLIRTKNNHMGLYAISVCILMGILGLFLLVSLDGYKFAEISLGMLQYSIYTVYTQFGFFIFPVLAINFIAIDYKEKIYRFMNCWDIILFLIFCIRRLYYWDLSPSEILLYPLYYQLYIASLQT